MKEKVLSVFVDESGDFGEFNPASPNYYVTMVLHDQNIDISKNICALEKQVTIWGYPEHNIHTGPLIRRESVYKYDLREENQAYFHAFDSIIGYNDYGQIELAQILTSVFNLLFSSVEFRKIEPNQYKLAQVADLICTVEAIGQKEVLTKSEIEFFHSKNEFRKNIYKNIVKKRI